MHVSGNSQSNPGRRREHVRSGASAERRFRVTLNGWTQQVILSRSPDNDTPERHASLRQTLEETLLLKDMFDQMTWVCVSATYMPLCPPPHSGIANSITVSIVLRNSRHIARPPVPFQLHTCPVTKNNTKQLSVMRSRIRSRTIRTT